MIDEGMTMIGDAIEFRTVKLRSIADDYGLCGANLTQADNTVELEPYFKGGRDWNILEMKADNWEDAYELFVQESCDVLKGLRNFQKKDPDLFHTELITDTLEEHDDIRGTAMLEIDLTQKYTVLVHQQEDRETYVVSLNDTSSTASTTVSGIDQAVKQLKNTMNRADVVQAVNQDYENNLSKAFEKMGVDKEAWENEQEDEWAQ